MRNPGYTGSTLGKVFTEYGLKRYLLSKDSDSELLSATLFRAEDTVLSPWLTPDKAKRLYYQYSAQADNLSQTAQIAAQDGWNWDAIRFMLSQSQWFAYIKKKLGRDLALKALNVAISLGTDYTAPGMDYEKNYVQKGMPLSYLELFCDRSEQKTPKIFAIPWFKSSLHSANSWANNFIQPKF